MGRKKLGEDVLQETINIWKESGKNLQKAATLANVKYFTFYSRLNKALEQFNDDEDEFNINPPFDPTEPVEETVERMLVNYDRNQRAEEERDLMPIKVNHDKPICVAFMGDPHIGNPGCNLRQFMNDVQTIRNTEGMKVINLGDTTDAWVGYLCKLYANSPVAVDSTWKLVEYFLGKEHGLGDQFLVAIAGNHDLFHDSYGDILEWIKEPRTPKGFTILIFHGNAGDIGDRVEKFKRFIDADHGLLFLEYRGYGGNPGKPTEKGLYSDANAALNFLFKQHIFSDKIILYGESLGCGIAAKLSSENTFAATILEAPYTSIADVAQRHYWFLPAKWLVLDRYEILEIINNIKSPLMVIHGEQDNVISIEFGKKVFEAAPEPKEALFISNAGHNNLFDFYADEKILVYLDKQLNF